jgi:hypothetical protein
MLEIYLSQPINSKRYRLTHATVLKKVHGVEIGKFGRYTTVVAELEERYIREGEPQRTRDERGNPVWRTS